MLEQIFLYVTRECNIHCITCYTRSDLMQSGDLNYSDIVQLLVELYAQGAWKLTILGGEPTIYPRLGDLITEAKKIGYNLVRINTNGIFNSSLLYDAGMRRLDIICFSIDGPTPEINDRIRSGGKLVVVMQNIEYARKLGYEVRVNSTINSLNIDYVEDIIQLAQDKGASLIYINVVFMMGEAINNPYLAVDPARWIKVYKKIVEDHKRFAIRIKISPGFSEFDNLEFHQKQGHQCLALKQSRLYVGSNGNIYPCLLFMNDHKYQEACCRSGKFDVLGKAMNSNTNINSYCHFLMSSTANYYPLCIFYKQRLNYD